MRSVPHRRCCIQRPLGGSTCKHVAAACCSPLLGTSHQRPVVTAAWAAAVDCTALQPRRVCSSITTGHIQRKDDIEMHVHWTHLCLSPADRGDDCSTGELMPSSSSDLDYWNTENASTCFAFFYYSISLQFKCRISSVCGESQGGVILLCACSLSLFLINIKDIFILSVNSSFSIQLFICIYFKCVFISALQSGDKFHCGATALTGGANPEGPFSVLLVLLASCSWIHRIDQWDFRQTVKASCLHSLNLYFIRLFLVTEKQFLEEQMKKQTKKTYFKRLIVLWWKKNHKIFNLSIYLFCIYLKGQVMAQQPLSFSWFHFHGDTMN